MSWIRAYAKQHRMYGHQYHSGHSCHGIAEIITLTILPTFYWYIPVFPYPVRYYGIYISYRYITIMRVGTVWYSLYGICVLNTRSVCSWEYNACRSRVSTELGDGVTAKPLRIATSIHLDHKTKVCLRCKESASAWQLNEIECFLQDHTIRATIEIYSSICHCYIIQEII